MRDRLSFEMSDVGTAMSRDDDSWVKKTRPIMHARESLERERKYLEAETALSIYIFEKKWWRGRGGFENLKTPLYRKLKKKVPALFRCTARKRAVVLREKEREREN